MDQIDLTDAPGWQPTAPTMPAFEGPGPLAVAWRDRWLILAIALLAGAISYTLSARVAPAYVAETTLAFPYAGSEVALAGGDAERSRSLRTEAERITSQALLERAAAALGQGFDADLMEKQVRAIPAGNADVITVEATAGNPEGAVAIADAVAAAYRRQIDRRQEQSIVNLEQRRRTLERRIQQQQTQLAAQLEQASSATDDAEVDGSPAVAASRLALEASVAQLSDVQARLDTMKGEQDISLGRIQVLRSAALPTEPERPQPLRDAVTVVLLAVLAFATIRWWRTEPDPPTVEDAQTVERVLGAPVLAEIPAVGQHLSAAGVVTEHYPQLIDAYRMAATMSPVRGAVLVTAARPGESCSDVVANIGAVLDRDGYRVLLVEGDAQVGRLRADRRKGTGLTDLTAGKAALDDCLLYAPRVGMGLLPWGQGGSALPRGAATGLDFVVEEMTACADLALIDGAPLASSANAVTIAAHVDGILLTVSTGTPLADLSRLRARLAQLDRPVLGAVLRRGTRSRPWARRRRTVATPPQWRRPAQAAASEPR